MRDYKVTTAPSKLPLNYVEKTLRRLLPSLEVIAAMSKTELVELAKRADDLRLEIAREPVRFFVPSEGGQREFLECDNPRQRVRLYISGNKGGKTTATVIKTLEYLLGRPIWGDRTQRSTSTVVPLRWAYYAEDFDSHKETVIPTIKTWAPPGSIIKEWRNPQGHVVQLDFVTGSVLHFRTYDQGSDKAEGKDYDGCSSDEPPPRDNYTAVFRGLVAKGGVYLIAATLLKEAWLYDECDLPHVAAFEGTIHDNPWIDQQAKTDFLASLDEDEREVRERGKPRSMVGLIFKNFKNGLPFVIPDHEPPPGYPIIMVLDPHERKPLHCMWAYVTPDDGLVVFRWELIAPENETVIFEQLDKVNLENGAFPHILVMDPNRGSCQSMHGDSWEKMFERHGYTVTLGMDKIAVGHTIVNGYLAYDENRPPALRFTERCRGVGGPVFAMQRYAWSDWSKQTKYDRSLKEQPKDRYKDWPDCLRYMCAEGFQFDRLTQGYDVIDLMGPHTRPIHGYI